MKNGPFMAKSKVFYKVYLANIVNTIIFIVLISIVSIKSNTHFILDNTININQESITLRKNILDDRVRGLDEYINIVVEQDAILDYMFSEEESQVTPTDLMAIVLCLQQLCDNNEMVQGISLIDVQQGIILDNTGMNSQGSYDIEQGNLTEPGLWVQEDGEGDSIRYVQSFNPLNLDKNIFIMLKLEPDIFYSNLLSQKDSNTRSYEEYLLTDQGIGLSWGVRRQFEPEIIEALNGMENGVRDIQCNDQNLLVYKERSEISGWSVVWLQNHTSLQRQSEQVIRTIIIACICMVLIASVLMYLLADFLYKPLKRLGSLVESKVPQERLGSANEYQMIEDAVGWLEKEHHNIAKKYQDSLPVLVQKCVYDLITGQYNDEQFLHFKVLTGKKMQQENYLLLICECKNGTESHRLMEDLKERFEDGERIEGAWATLPGNKTAWLLNTDMTYEKILEMLRGLKEQSETIHSVWYVSRMFKNIENINLIYNELEAKQAQKFFKGKNVLIYEEDTEMNRGDIIEKRKLQTIILKYIKAGEPECIREEMHQLTEKLSVGKDSIQYICFQYYELCIRLVHSLMEMDGRVCSGEEERRIFELLFSSGSLEELEQRAGDILTGLSENYTKKTVGYSANVEKAVAYIRMNYQKDLSLEDVAGAVYLSAGYLSNIFKNETGDTVFEYITQVRMQKAKELLLEKTSMKIKEISEEVGYLNIQSFLRYFKKYYGLTPVEFRHAQAINKDENGSMN